MSNQLQKSGDGLTTTTDMIANAGISHVEARQMVRDIIGQELSVFKNEAFNEFSKRIDKISEKFVNAVDETNKGDLSAFKDPDFQYIIYKAGVDYARRDSATTAEILVSLISERSKRKNHSITQAVLNESIEIAGKLTDDQLKILAGIFVSRNLVLKTNDLYELGQYFNKTIAGPGLSFSTNDLEFTHLEYFGCTIDNMKRWDVLAMFTKTYGGLFLNPLEVERLPADLLKYKDNPEIFFVAENTPDKVQPNGFNEALYTKKLTEMNIPSADVSKLVELFPGTIFNSNIITQKITDVSPGMETFFKKWNNSRMSRYTLTSVGAALAISYLKSINPSSLDFEVFFAGV